MKIGPLLAETWKCCPIPLVLVGLALTRNNTVLGLLFSTHGGIGWPLLWLAFPWVLIRAGLLAYSAPAELRAAGRRDAVTALLIYLVVALVCSAILVWLLAPNFGLRDTLPWFFFPVGLLAQI